MVEESTDHMVATSAQDLAAVPLEYVPIDVGPGGATLVAHDRNRLKQIVVEGLVPKRVLRVSSLPADVSIAARVESNAFQRARRLRRNAQAQFLAHVLAACGLPFLSATLLGLTAILFRDLTLFDGAIYSFLGSAGGSLGGLPLAIAISLVPSVLLVKRAYRVRAACPEPRFDEAMMAVTTLDVEQDAHEFFSSVEELVHDIGGLLAGKTSIGGDRAIRLARAFDELRAVAAAHHVHSVQALAGDIAAQFRGASRPPQRLFPGLYRRRPSVDISTVLAPYHPSRQARLPVAASIASTTLCGVLIALGTFLGSGVFRLSAEEALTLVPNEMVMFRSSASVVALGRGIDGPSTRSQDVMSVVRGPGLYWAWPRPLTDRTAIRLTDRLAEISVRYETQTSAEEVRVKFRYDITDLQAFVRLGPPELSDQVFRSALGQGFEEFVRGTRDMLVQQRGQVADVSVDKEMQAGMGVLANRFVSVVNTTKEISASGILLRSNPEIEFRRI
tara:strand:- start:16950 stop:18455 length:1506 start_codon:yes stop_codon:yes gene_type:complete